MPPNDPAPSRALSIEAAASSLRFDDERPGPVRTAIPVETPVEIAFGGFPFAVMMMTPDDLADFAVGFCLTEGLIAAPSDIRRLVVEEAGPGLRVAVELAPARMAQHLARRRAMTGRTGCGVCGIEDLGSLERATAPVAGGAPIERGAIRRALRGLEEGQALNRITRAVHAAAWATRDGTVTHVREDVGRHNALDKLIGALLAAGVDPADGFALITSRCSYEMVEKAAAFGAGLLVAISAPTSLAIERARALGVALVGVARDDGAIAFTGDTPAPDRTRAA